MRPRNLKLVSVLLAAGLVVGAYSGLSNAPVSGSTPAALVPALATAALPPAPMLPPLNLIPPPPVGSYPDFVFTPDTVGGNTMTIDLGLAVNGTWNVPNTTGQGIYDPVAWVVVYYLNDMVVPQGKTILFRNHPSRAPVAFLLYDRIEIAGTVDVSGDSGLVGGPYSGYAMPGPGGFRGGRGSTSFMLHEHSAGFGPGGATLTITPGSPFYLAGGTSGSYSTPGLIGCEYSGYPGLMPGSVYGDQDISQLIGGSGGGAANSSSDIYSSSDAGAGGGAILLAANLEIMVRSSGAVLANGGWPASGVDGHCYYTGGNGSGGTIRMVSDHVALESASGSGATIRAMDYYGHNPGRIRIESNNSGDLMVSTVPSASLDIGHAATTTLLPGSTSPRLTVTGIGGFLAPFDPRAELQATADVTLAQSGLSLVEIKGENLPTSWQVFLRVTRARGDATIVPVTVAPSGNNTLWTRTLQVDLSSGFSVLQAYANP